MRTFPVIPNYPQMTPNAPKCPHLNRAWTTTGSSWGDEIEVEVCMDCGKVIDSTFDWRLMREESDDDPLGF